MDAFSFRVNLIELLMPASNDAIDFVQGLNKVKEAIDFLLLSDEEIDHQERQELINKSFDVIGGQYDLPETKADFLKTNPDTIIYGLTQHLKSENQLSTLYNYDIPKNLPKNAQSHYVARLRGHAKDAAFYDSYLRDTSRLDNIDGINSSPTGEVLDHMPGYIHPREREYKAYKARQRQIELERLREAHEALNHSFLRDEHGKVNLNEYGDGTDFLEKLHFQKHSFWALREAGIVPNNFAAFRTLDYDLIMGTLIENQVVVDYPEYRSLEDENVRQAHYEQKAQEYGVSVELLTMDIRNVPNQDDCINPFQQNSQDVSFGQRIANGVKQAVNFVQSL
ncbi:hypothetical protein [uncultured Kordia sp.]|uniref:hypothetical protein n=1 Tax=uncultured Kordia sp. TaxID=507699 RepID=UPI002638ABC4|nr:hypothetical protein [uncultured Kordia sp.]